MPLLSIASVLDQELQHHPRVVLLCSANRKHPWPAPAGDLYHSEFFRLAKQYADQLSPKRLFILSAVHGLVAAEEELAPYTMTMSALGQGDVKSWGKMVATQLQEAVHLHRHEVIILGLGRFANPILKHIPQAIAPLVSMTLAQAMQFLREQAGTDSHRSGN